MNPKVTYGFWMLIITGWQRGKEPACQSRRCRRRGFDLWVRNIPWRRKWQLTPVFIAWRIPWIEESGGIQSMGSQRVRLD